MEEACEPRPRSSSASNTASVGIWRVNRDVQDSPGDPQPVAQHSANFESSLDLRNGNKHAIFEEEELGCQSVHSRVSTASCSSPGLPLLQVVEEPKKKWRHSFYL
jgi:hypothetical protein